MGAVLGKKLGAFSYSKKRDVPMEKVLFLMQKGGQALEVHFIVCL